jgi:hypothetical protein
VLNENDTENVSGLRWEALVDRVNVNVNVNMNMNANGRRLIADPPSQFSFIGRALERTCMCFSFQELGRDHRQDSASIISA